MTNPEDTKNKGIEFLAEQAASNIVSRFQHLKIGDNDISCPFWMNNDPDLKNSKLYFSRPNGGKYTFNEIEDLAKDLLSKINDPKKLSNKETWEIMRENGLGIDCSGLSYRICENIYSSLTDKNDFDKFISNKNGESGATKISASDLTSSKNSLFISDWLTECKPGDLVRCLGGKHILTIIGVRNGILRCAHSTDVTPTIGVSSFDIIVKDPSKSIFEQKWTEINNKGKDYNTGILEKGVHKGDGVWRLKILNRLYNK